MKIAVLGSGVIGVTTAYYLARDGHEVVVIDRQSGPAMETSFANAGEISPGYASPWAGPGMPAKAIGWILSDYAPLILRLKPSGEMLRWLLSMLRNCTADRYAINKSRMVRLAEYSRDALIDLRAAEDIQYDQRMQGTLQVFSTEKQVVGAAKDVEILQRGGVPFEILDAAGCITAEPGLATVREKIAGGLRLPNDETGDCYKFTVALMEICRGLGVRFQNETRIIKLEGGKDGITSVSTNKGPVHADRYVVALGSFSRGMTAPLGIDLPIYPVKGYSITVPIGDPVRAPVSTVMHESYKVAITRLGDRIRVGGMAEISGYETKLSEKRRATLSHALEDLFPGAAGTLDVPLWSGLRPMTPDGPPILGPTDIPNLLLNTGHGTLGWTMACGSARVLADLIAKRQPDIDVSDLRISRFAGGNTQDI
jgi:D-amino-acid dehydrogenase